MCQAPLVHKSASKCAGSSCPQKPRRVAVYGARCEGIAWVAMKKSCRITLDELKGGTGGKLYNCRTFWDIFEEETWRIG